LFLCFISGDYQVNEYRSPATPPKIPATSGPTVDDRLQKLNDLFGQKLISQTEFEAKRQQIISEI